ncbi:MAG: addiction module protein [Spirochaetes bacterium GWF1_31_7]|nr:MAG: addiction module protein [Spirochaetes bacterium GWE2_31_10]OHD52913.1 MAG: addiction module protein [Spirochaetes bacterium GWF1_31_7]OHD82888.1 MAG: addiction module protein [Spirochaetes bacterium RIFOXYB1_FULL_32_8]HBI37156.1 addiction module protein [Spirochaetia bacterium]
MNNFNPRVPYNELPLLPPDNGKIESIKILRQENKAIASISELKGIAHIIPNQSILINAIVLQEAKDSSEIENIITTKDKLYKAVSSNAKKYDPATKEVMFYREALYEGFKKIKERGFLSINDIVDLQKVLIQNDAGIRKTPGTALVNDTTDEVIFTPPQGRDEISNLLTNLVKYLNDDERSLIKLAVLHYQFETIHPFYDGNGRTGRIINILYLILKDYLDIPILYLSSYIIKNKAKYYELLLSVTKDENWEEWILYILKAIEDTANETIGKIKKIKALLDKTIEEIKEKLPKIYSKELVETLFVHPYCKSDFLTSELGIERKTASKYLHVLVDIGILELYKVGKENIFVNIELMEILKK